MISFIIPTLNEEKIIEKILLNLSGYLGEKEIIISDGNSSDKTIEISKKYTDKIFIYKGQARQTIGMGRNLGAKEAKGDILLFLDADVHIPDINNFIARSLSRLNDKKIVALGAFIQVEKPSENFADRVILSFMNRLYQFQNNILHLGIMSGEFQMIRAESFRKVNGFNEKLAASEDVDLFSRLAKIGQTRIFTDMVVYHTGRRAHKIGWPKLLWQWFMNYSSVIILGKSKDNEWKEIR